MSCLPLAARGEVPLQDLLCKIPRPASHLTSLSLSWLFLQSRGWVTTSLTGLQVQPTGAFKVPCAC